MEVLTLIRLSATNLDFWQKQYGLVGDEDIHPPNPDIDVDTVNLGALTFQVRGLEFFFLFRLTRLGQNSVRIK